MHIDVEAIVCSARAHGEHGAVVRFLTAESGLVAGYVSGARSRRLRPVLSSGNIVRVRLDNRGAGQMPRASVELERSRAALALDAGALAIAEWLTGIVVTLLPEGQPFPELHATIGAVLDLAELQTDQTVTLAALARFELLLLAELGYGLDLSKCAVTGGTAALAYVSPRTGRAVGVEPGRPYADRLFRLPRFLIESCPATATDVSDALALTRHFIVRDLIAGGYAGSLLAARERAVR